MAQTGENIVLKRRELYYIVTMYKYYQLTLFLVLIGKFDQKPNFQPRLASIRPYKSRIGNKDGENMVLKSRE